MNDSLITAFRDSFRGHPAGVTLITATVDDEPVGIVLSSVSSLSLDPLSISFSFMKRTGSAEKLLRAESLMVHFLSDCHADLAALFARSSAERFSPDQGWLRAPTGEPLLPNCRAVMRVKIADTAQAGESTLCAAEVLDIQHDDSKSALLFMGHKFYSIDGLQPRA